MMTQSERIRVYTHSGTVPITVDQCDGYPDFANADLDNKGRWYVPCDCCSGRGEHTVGVGPDIDAYWCEICGGVGGWWLTQNAHHAC
jgi:hypothetical protein